MIVEISGFLFGLLAAVPVIAALLLGAQIRVVYLRDVVRNPVPLAVGLTGQFILLPTMAAVFFYAYPLSGDLRWVWFILAAVPGGAISNMVTFLGRGRLSLSVILTACSTLAGMFTIPLWVGVGLRLLGDGAERQLPVSSMVLGSFVLLVVPFGIGIVTGMAAPAFAERMRRPTRAAMLVLLLVGAIAYVAQRWQSIAADFDAGLFAGAAMFHAVVVITAWGLGRTFKLDRCDSFTVSIEVGVQNVVIALLIVELLNRPDMVPFIGYYMFAMIVLLAVWIPAFGMSPKAKQDTLTSPAD